MESSNINSPPSNTGVDAVMASLRKWLQVVLKILEAPEGLDESPDLIPAEEALMKDILESLHAEGVDTDALEKSFHQIKDTFGLSGSFTEAIFGSATPEYGEDLPSEDDIMQAVEAFETSITELFNTEGAKMWLEKLNQKIEPLMSDPECEQLLQRIEELDLESQLMNETATATEEELDQMTISLVKIIIKHLSDGEEEEIEMDMEDKNEDEDPADKDLNQ